MVRGPHWNCSVYYLFMHVFWFIFNPFLFLILMHLLLLFYVFEVLYAKLEILLFMTCTV